ncbi:hypothetical protein [Natrialba sp. INN-245]|uniref:hypothetical protein n=1 Tax=Natrialba sp. INN-245 TaxID=2690967 RepID=UPI001313BAA0|nr:hypothetical protein [Natrialba sp. INN-245]MWV39953.1 hypothetical protein [Natrialba sp. INN-245]
MIERADAILAMIPMLAMSGFVVRSIVTTTGVGTGLLAVPLAPIGYFAAFGLIVGELLVGPVAERSSEEST